MPVVGPRGALAGDRCPPNDVGSWSGREKRPSMPVVAPCGPMARTPCPAKSRENAMSRCADGHTRTTWGVRAVHQRSEGSWSRRKIHRAILAWAGHGCPRKARDHGLEGESQSATRLILWGAGRGLMSPKSGEITGLEDKVSCCAGACGGGLSAKKKRDHAPTGRNAPPCHGLQLVGRLAGDDCPLEGMRSCAWEMKCTVRPVGCTLWGAYGGWPSPNRPQITGREEEVYS